MSGSSKEKVLLLGKHMVVIINTNPTSVFQNRADAERNRTETDGIWLYEQRTEPERASG